MFYIYKFTNINVLQTALSLQNTSKAFKEFCTVVYIFSVPLLTSTNFLISTNKLAPCDARDARDALTNRRFVSMHVLVLSVAIQSF